MKPSEVWITKSGQSIKIKDMSVSHLTNTIKMIRRNVKEYKSQLIEKEIGYLTRFSGDPDFNAIIADDVVYKYTDMEDEEFLINHHPTYKIMLGELQEKVGEALCMTKS